MRKNDLHRHLSALTAVLAHRPTVGRAGGGAELGGLRALDFCHQRAAVQASPEVLQALGL